MIDLHEEIKRLNFGCLSFFERRVLKSFSKREYWQCLKNLTKAENYTRNSRLLSLLKSYCYYKLNLLRNAIEVTQDWFPYENVDIIDHYMLLLLSELHVLEGRPLVAKKYIYAYNTMVTSNKDVETGKNNCSVSFDNNLDDNFAISIENHFFTEFCIFQAFAEKIGRVDEVERNWILKNYPSILKFKNDLKNNQYTIVYLCDTQSFTEHDKIVLSVLKNLGNFVTLMDSSYKHIKNFYNSQKAEYIMLLAKDNVFSDLCENSMFLRESESFFRHFENIGSPRLSCMLFGEYFAMMKKKYNYDFSDWHYTTVLYDFSIVIPVRNESKYLMKAIESCLAQDYQGPFEILISDNSAKNNDEVQRCVGEFSDARIRYIRTPSELPLAKSFEFAYLSAKGKYLLSIGSDDAVLPFCLSVLYKEIERNQSIRLFSWRNATYNWPIYGFDTTNSIIIKYFNFYSRVVNSTEMLANYRNQVFDFAYFPKLYLSTCFRRDVIDSFISSTGKFMNGYSQDIYSGAVALHIDENYLYFGFPLAISGTSSTSTGLNDKGYFINQSRIANWLNRFYSGYDYFNTFQKVCTQIQYRLESCSFDLLEFVEFKRVEPFFPDHSIFTSHDLVQRLIRAHRNIPRKYCDKPFIRHQFETLLNNLPEENKKYLENLFMKNRSFYFLYREIKTYTHNPLVLPFIINILNLLNRKKYYNQIFPRLISASKSEMKKIENISHAIVYVLKILERMDIYQKN